MIKSLINYSPWKIIVFEVFWPLFVGGEFQLHHPQKCKIEKREEGRRRQELVFGKKGEEDGKNMCQRKVGKVRGGGQRWGENVEGRHRSGIVSEEDYRYRVFQKNATLLILNISKMVHPNFFVLLVCYSVLPYNSKEPNFSFLWWLWLEIWCL